MIEVDNEELVNRRSALAKATEWSAGILLGIRGFQNWNSQDEYNVLNLRGATLESEPTYISPSINAQVKFSESIEILRDVYHEHFEEVNTTYIPLSDGETVSIHAVETTSWTQPSSFPEIEYINSWSNRALNTKFANQNLTTGKLVDINKLARVGIETEQGNDLSRKALTALVYGGSVGMLVGYEEILAFNSSKKNGTSYHHERYEKSSSTQETRRGFIKIAAAVVGIGAASSVHNRINDRISRGRERLGTEVNEVAINASKASSIVIEEFYGKTVIEEINNIKAITTASKKALNSVVDSREVRMAFVNIINCGSDYLELINKVRNSPENKNGLAYLIKCHNATQKLESASAEDQRVAAIGAILEGLGVCAAMSLILVPGEIVNRKLKKLEN